MGRRKTRSPISTPRFPLRPKFYRGRDVWVRGWLGDFFGLKWLDWIFSGLNLPFFSFNYVAYTKIQKIRSHHVQLHPKKNTKICYVQYRLRAVSLFLHIYLGECLSRLAPSVTRVDICVSRAFCSTDRCPQSMGSIMLTSDFS